jgi:hypothetical protein
MLSSLGSQDSHVREAARAALVRLKRADLPELRRAIEKARPLLPSQTAMLPLIVREIYLAEEKYEPLETGFLGILMDPSSLGQADFVPENDSATRALGVVVTGCIPGFCAGRAILDGDLILGTTKPFRPFRRYEDLRDVIGGLPAGTVVKLLILRRGQVIEATLKLDAHPKELPSPDQVTPFAAARDKRFDAYWKREFEPVMRGKVG